MTKQCILLIILMLSSYGFSQRTTAVDSMAVKLLDKMTAVLGELSAVSVEVKSENERINDLEENELLVTTHQLQFSGPDRMTIHSRGDNGNKAIWYNGKYLTYYSFDENNFIQLNVPDTTIKMIDSIHQEFGIKFPAADIFYPTLTEDILNNFDHVRYLGLKTIDGQECFHIMGTSDALTFQLWISNNAFYLPKRYLFIDKNNKYQHDQGTFSNWIFNPVLPDVIFEFSPPVNARLISIMSKS